MKEITRVHLAKTPYDIEVDAKKALEKYLAGIKTSMNADDEAMREIEARMVELLGESGVSPSGVISLQEVDQLKQKMGNPGDFIDENEVPSSSVADSEVTNRRWMRDEDDAMIGGVCAGIASRLNVSVALVRFLAIVLLFMSFGTALLVYIVLWIVLPPAKTAADKLSMRGQPVNLESIKNYSDTNEVVQKKNPWLLRVVRIVLGVGLIFMALGLLITLLVGGGIGVATVAQMGEFTAQPWAIGLLVSLAVGGIAAVILTTLLATAVMKWKFTSATATAVVVSLVVGAISISGIGLFGIYTADNLARDEKRLMKVVELKLPEDLTGVKYYKVDNYPGLSIYDTDDSKEKITANLKYFALDGVKAPQVDIRRDGDTLVLSAHEDQQTGLGNCLLSYGGILNCSAYGIYQVEFKGPIEAIQNSPQMINAAEVEAAEQAN